MEARNSDNFPKNKQSGFAGGRAPGRRSSCGAFGKVQLPSVGKEGSPLGRALVIAVVFREEGPSSWPIGVKPDCDQDGIGLTAGCRD